MAPFPPQGFPPPANINLIPLRSHTMLQDIGVAAHAVKGQLVASASPNTRISNDALKAFTNTSPVLQKEIRFNAALPLRSIRIRFEMRSLHVAQAAVGRIFRNGAVIGTERTAIGTTWTAFEEDLAPTIGANDNIQIFCHVGADTGQLQNFRILFDGCIHTIDGLTPHTVLLYWEAPFVPSTTNTVV